MRDLDEYLADAFEYLDEPREIPAAEPVDTTRPVPEALRRRLFTHQVYPYSARIGIKDYYTQKYELQVELVKLQNWIKDTQRKILLIFEGRDAAGKGSTIKRFMEHLNPRGARVVALERPTKVEEGQWYFQRHLRHLPGPGEIVLFDRSWYNRAGVERVMGFCNDAELEEFFAQVPALERMLVRSGVHLCKFYFSVSREEQHRRFEQRRTDPLKGWKLSPMDLASEARWDDYTVAKEEMFRRSHTAVAPWTVIKSDDKMRARLQAMRHVLSQFEYADKDAAVAGPDPLLVASADEIYPEIQG
ncbi:polyphosphate kinase 2 [Paraliomyxa miuraensis]|uniref:polyphosphate kinase 2 n=1 Tax=Paraliomyxa miuraensis TaxID=376150 RepID=UPI00224D6D61|nr:polyphosphate kinase 2 [Paraliomyxa miuraensis]MCX4240435.1 polyphosphate kinase 2 [Paraliomyxa miuraensis]